MTRLDWQRDRREERRRIRLVAGLTGGVLILEVAGGMWSGSLALLADAGHMLTDVLALLLALVALSIAERRPADQRRTWGYHRVEILAALANSVLLLALPAFIVVEAWQRFREPRTVDAPVMLAVAAVGLAANLAGMWLLRWPGGSLNLRAALGHVSGDALASLGVLLAGALIAVTGLGRIDLLASIGIAGIIVVGTIRLLTEAIGVLLEGAPRGIDCGEVAEAMRGVSGVAQVHDLHIWSITTGMPALSGHVVLEPAPAPTDPDGVLRDLKLLLADRFGIHHSTIQVESDAFEEVGELH